MGYRAWRATHAHTACCIQAGILAHTGTEGWTNRTATGIGTVTRVGSIRIASSYQVLLWVLKSLFLWSRGALFFAVSFGLSCIFASLLGEQHTVACRLCLIYLAAANRAFDQRGPVLSFLRVASSRISTSFAASDSPCGLAPCALLACLPS
ncbi:hypothetical protein BC567DRAFT_221705 [Phyllosticta citribraziliensis]